MSAKGLIQAYEAILRQMEVLDRDYYGKRNPSHAECAAYYRRKQRAEEMRTRFYATLEAIRTGERQLWHIGTNHEVVTRSLAIN